LDTFLEMMMLLKHQVLYFVLQITCLKVQVAKSCTNLIVTQGASSDGSILLAYNADDTELMGMLYHYPAKTTNGTGKMRKIYSWDNGAFLGEIPEANATFNVVGNANEYGLVIAETSW
jgi:dipeptidase